MAKKSNLIRLGDAISQLLKQEKLDVRLTQFNVRNNWKDIAGEIVARHTGEISFNGSTIFVSITSPALRHELSMRKQDLIRNINNYAGSSLVNEIVLR